MHNHIVGFEWDAFKASANARKHGVQFAEAMSVFTDEYAITLTDDESSRDEQRFVTMGMGMKARVLVVVYCFRGKSIRIISARPATKQECQRYEQQL